MKTYFIPILILIGFGGSVKAQNTTAGQVAGAIANIALKGDANTEQSAKLELIRILQERITKLTVGQMNSRVIVSTGVRKYYKVGEIYGMVGQIGALRGKYTTLAANLGKNNSGFGESGNNFSWKYMLQYNTTMAKVYGIKKQLDLILADGKPLVLPPMPTFTITPASSADDVIGSFAATMNGITGKYGVKSQADLDALPADQRAEFQSAVDAAKADFEGSLKASMNATTKSSLTLLGNVVGTLFGVPGAGTLIAGLVSGNTGGISGLVGSIVDKFTIPDEYFDSESLKLTDSERIKIIDDLHLHISELFQQTIALGTNMSSEAKVRYNEISQPRNEMILNGPKK